MAAGESAAHEFDRHRRRATELAAERRRMEQQLTQLDRREADARAMATAWEAGALGERAVGAVLDRLPGWVVLHDRRRTVGSPANIDHLAIGPAGVVVVDAKNWSGAVGLGPDGVLRQNGRPRSAEVAAVAADVSRVRGELRAEGWDVPVTGLLCFVQDVGVDGYVRTPAGVGLIGLQQVRPWLLAQPSRPGLPEPIAIAGALNLLHPRRVAPQRVAAPRPPHGRTPVRRPPPPRRQGGARPAPVAPRPSPVGPAVAGLGRTVLGTLLLASLAVAGLLTIPRLMVVGLRHAAVQPAQATAGGGGLTGSALTAFCVRLGAASRDTTSVVTAAPAGTGTCTVRAAGGRSGVVREGTTAALLLGRTTASGTGATASCGHGWYEAAQETTTGNARIWSDEDDAVPVAACVAGDTSAEVLQLVHTARHALA